MDLIRQEFQVSFSYPVHFTRDLFVRANPLLRSILTPTAPGKPSRVLVVVDDGVARAHPRITTDIAEYCDAHADAIELAGSILVVPGGERSKNDTSVLTTIVDAIHDAALCRHSYVAVVGGGAVLDVAGYAAATAHRGVRLIRIPTTVLAQDDSAVGVKNGINSFGKKNYLGTFAPPFAVINDFAFLTTLQDRDWLSGVSEAVKAALIKDAAFFDGIEQQADRLVRRDMTAMEAIIRRSAELHLGHIATGGDPFELGSSRPLDFGHWAAHKLEWLTDHRLRHGEAVAVGIALDTTYSHLAGFLPEAQWRRIIALLQALRLPIYAPELSRDLTDPDRPGSVLRGLDEFREHLGGRLTIMLLEAIGRPFDVHEIRTDLVVRAVDVLRSLASGAGGEDRTDYEYPISTEREGTRR
jgi:3-dehydroquinate synthase